TVSLQPFVTASLLVGYVWLANFGLLILVLINLWVAISFIGGLTPQTPQQGNNCFPTTLRNRFALGWLCLAG
ncbi:MAG: hypothetical protein WBG70_03520, partial [Spirulinaceae cyanobacterium]